MPSGSIAVVDHLSRAQARRVALAAQGFRDRRPVTPTLHTLSRTLTRTGVLQVDSVNVLQRAHYMPLYSRMGPYDVELVRRASEGPRHRRRMVEYWAHVQAFMPVDLWPFMHHRRAAYREARGKWFRGVSPEAVAALLAEIERRGASTARELEHTIEAGGRRTDHWGWNWSQARKGLDYLYLVGDVAIAGRTSQFEVRYDLPDRVLPPQVLAAPTPSVVEADRELVLRAARSHGVATPRCLADYYRTTQAPVKRVVADLIAEGELLPVRVEGWATSAYLHRDAAVPRTVAARSLLSPFDPVVWERRRTERLFDFRYRLEIYTPAERRVHGYYVLPFLLGEQIVARVDLKADRAGGVLVVRSAWVEDGAPAETPSELAAELEALAGWLGLSAIRVDPRGDLAADLTAAVAERV